jgi:serine O-acetyltransferase
MLVGDMNNNPDGIVFRALIAEDFRTHGSSLFEPGFWAVAIHRFGNWRMGIRSKLLRLPFSALYKILHPFVRFGFGIDLPYPTILGRRVRIWHHGGIFMGARSIGDDVHLRHNTTMGVLHRGESDAKPVIGNRVDIGPGAVILGGIEIGDDVVIGANSVVLRDVPAKSTVLGIPARPVQHFSARGREVTTGAPEGPSTP